MNHRFLKAGWVMVVAVAAAVWFAGSAEALEIRSGSGEFQAVIEPVKPVFAAGEKIQFKVKGNKQFYLYLFSIDAARNRGVMVLPNKLQEYNRYKENTEYTIPEKGVEFFSETPGTERIIMVASTKKLDVKLEKFTKSGDFFTSDAGNMEEETKALRLRSGEKEDERVVQELTLVIAGQGQSRVQPPPPPPSGGQPGPAPAPSEKVSAFISTDRVDYRIGDPMTITYGADKPGFVYLIAIEPNGKRTFLKKQEVSGDRFYQEQAVATMPGGQHSLMAIYSKDGNLGQGTVDQILSEQKTKGIELVSRPESYAVYQLNVLP